MDKRFSPDCIDRFAILLNKEMEEKGVEPIHFEMGDAILFLRNYKGAEHDDRTEQARNAN